MSILAIDPGTDRSAVVQWDGEKIKYAQIVDNIVLLWDLRFKHNAPYVAIEWIESYGMPVGKEVFVTCRWCGRFEEAAVDSGSVYYVTRKQVKSHHCHSTRATDANVRQALIDRFGPPGTVKTPGLTYGLKKATYWYDTNNQKTKGNP